MRTRFVGSSTGIAILPSAVMVLGILCIETSIAKTTIIRSIHRGRNTSESIKLSLMFYNTNEIGGLIILCICKND